MHSATTLEDLRCATRWQNVTLVAALPPTGIMLDCHTKKNFHGVTAALHQMSTRWRKYAGPGNTKIDLHAVRKSTRWQKLIVKYVVDPLLGTGTCGCRTELIDDVTVSESRE